MESPVIARHDFARICAMLVIVRSGEGKSWKTLESFVDSNGIVIRIVIADYPQVLAWRALRLQLIYTCKSIL